MYKGISCNLIESKWSLLLFSLLSLLIAMPVFAWKPAKSHNDVITNVKLKEDSSIYEEEISIQANSKRSYAAKSLNGLIEELLTYNPELRSLVYKINASRDRISQAASLDDPRFSIEAMHVPTGNLSLSRTPMTGIQMYLRQKVPFPTKLITRKNIEKAKYNQVNQEYLERMNQLVGKFKKVYYDYGLITESLYIHERNKRRLDALVAILEARYATGTTPQQDVLKTKLESDNIRNQIIQLQRRRKVILARLNTLLARPVESYLKLIRAKSAYRGLNQSLAALLQISKENRPWIKKAGYQVDEAKEALTLAKEGLLPDFDFGVGYRIRKNSPGDPVMGANFVAGGVSINVPWLWTLPRHAKNISETKKRHMSQKYFRESIIQEVRYQVTHSYQDVLQFKSQIQLFRNRIIPESIATVDASLTSYEAGEVDYMNLITSQLALFNNELALVRYRYEHAKRMADLEVAVGKPF